MINVFSQVIDTPKLWDIQRKQYTEKIIIEDSVEAGTTKQGVLSITNLGDFYLKYITGSFSTLVDVGGNVTDDGVCHLRGKLIDGGSNTSLFGSYIPLNLLLSPGRQKSSLSAGVITDPQGSSLFYPVELEYIFAKSNDIIFDVKNDSNTTNTYTICFHGIRRLNKA